MKHKLIGELLVQKKIINDTQLKRALQYKTTTGYRLGHCLIKLGYINEKDLMRVLSQQLGTECRELKEVEVHPQLIENVTEEFCRKNSCIPVKLHGHKLSVAMTDPFDVSIVDDLRLLTGKEISAVLGLESGILQLIDRYFSRHTAGHEEKEKTRVKSDIISNVNEIIFEAIEKRASDIHIENYGEKALLRYRIDGYLYEQREIAAKDLAATISRIKIMSDLNIAEKRLPQDGRIVIQDKNYNVDIRVSIIPGIYGENVVLRLLDKGKFIPDLDNIGLEGKGLSLLKKLITRPYGLILVSGPTGSGKTTTLYSIIQRINSKDKKVLTIEDPVEYKLDNVLQVEVKPGIGLDFSRGLRSFLRHDPDIIMVGEIRDYETAEIAIRASLTGHLVLSTVHTNNASSAVTRLLDMKVEPFLVASTTVLVMSQRLVRTLCDKCKVPEDKKSAGYRPKGCKECGQTGFKGRTGIFELMEITPGIRKAVTANKTAEEINDIAVKQGMISMYESGMEKVKQGLTTVDEVRRVI
ncbi:MAG: GspE/PulE family protein [bacterium]|nr:GspE/PulE family protein [bacterium]